MIKFWRVFSRRETLSLDEVVGAKNSHFSSRGEVVYDLFITPTVYLETTKFDDSRTLTNRRLIGSNRSSL